VQLKVFLIVIIVLLLLLSMSLFALVSYLVLLICCSAIRLLSRKCGIKLRVCSYGISQPIATKFDEKKQWPSSISGNCFILSEWRRQNAMLTFSVHSL